MQNNYLLRPRDEEVGLNRYISLLNAEPLTVLVKSKLRRLNRYISLLNAELEGLWEEFHDAQSS